MPKLLTLCIICRKSHILLGMKKRGFGAGKWNGFGGKVGPDETLEHAAEREVQEEAGIVVENLNHVGKLHFEFQGDPEILEVHVFVSQNFHGEPVETEEMNPKWFSLTEIPYKEMWPDDQYWLPLLLSGKRFVGNFLFNSADTILSYTLKEIESLS